MPYGVCKARVQRGFRALLIALVALAAMPVVASTPVQAPKILVLGDSLSAAYGLSIDQGWVALLEHRVNKREPSWQVVNASMSGETTAGGRSRIATELQRHRPQLLVLALGANDGLRGLPLDQTRANLEAIIVAAQAAQAKVLLVGMRLPPNYGPEYTAGFENNYRDLSARYRTALLPFLLEPIASERKAFQSDNLHPVAAAQPRLLEHVWVALAPLLKR